MSAQKNITLSIDKSLMIGRNNFNPITDRVCGSFNEWGTTNQLSLERGLVYSSTVLLNQHSLYKYAFFTNSPAAPNSGLEVNSNETTKGNRLIDPENTAQNLPVKPFNNKKTTQADIDMDMIEKKINVLKYLKLSFNMNFSDFKRMQQEQQNKK